MSLHYTFSDSGGKRKGQITASALIDVSYRSIERYWSTFFLRVLVECLGFFHCTPETVKATLNPAPKSNTVVPPAAHLSELTPTQSLVIPSTYVK